MIKQVTSGIIIIIIITFLFKGKLWFSVFLCLF